MNPGWAVFAVVASVAFIVVVLMLFFIAHKVRRVHLMLYQLRTAFAKDVETAFAQAEALMGLYLELGFKTGLPPTRGWAASPDFLLDVAQHALRRKPNVIVECSSGVSTLVLARCAQLSGVGHVYSLEHDEAYAKQTIENLSRHSLSDFATVIHAPLRLQSIDAKDWHWYALDEFPVDKGIDLLVIDGPPSQSDPLARYPAGPMLFHRMAVQGIVYLDDAARPGEQAIIERWQAEFGFRPVRQPRCEKGCAVLLGG